MKLTLLSAIATLSSVVTASAGSFLSPVAKRAACGNPFRFFGVNEAGAESNNSGRLPGVAGEDYIWPTVDSVNFFIDRKFNTFRIPFLLERVSPTADGPFDSGYLGKLKEAVTYLTSRGSYVVLDPHNSMKYQGASITYAPSFQQWWGRFAAEFKSNRNIAFEVMNAPVDLSAPLVAELNQAAINGIRGAGATSQLIILEGTAKSVASSWVTSGNAAAFASIRDPNNNIAFGVRQYFNYNNDGTGEDCVSSNIGVERLAPFTQWLVANRQKGFLVEFGGGSEDANCVPAIQNALCLMQSSGVWLGGTYWAAGPWWRDHWMSIEPPDGAAIKRILPEALLPFL